MFSAIISSLVFFRGREIKKMKIPKTDRKRSTLTIDLKAQSEAFRRSCESREVTPSAELRRLVDKSLKEESKGYRPAFKTTGQPDATRLRREVRFSESEHEAATRLATRLGTNVQGMLLAFVRSAAVTHSIFSDKELLALGVSSNQLGAIGRNFNQIVRRLNRDFDPMPPDYAEAIKQIEGIRQEIKQQINTNAALITAAQERWQFVESGVKHG